ncbi:hypothetical protein Bbelb_266620 [Branchiostoma belcheri]|nr:hypothetical protein Bbelb_266620 [Branchiostoma belcheri]
MDTLLPIPAEILFHLIKLRKVIPAVAGGTIIEELITGEAGLLDDKCGVARRHAPVMEPLLLARKPPTGCLEGEECAVTDDQGKSLLRVGMTETDVGTCAPNTTYVHQVKLELCKYF